MAIFTFGNLLCAVSPGFGLVLTARVITGFAHGTFFGTSAVVAQAIVPPHRKASAIAIVFTGLTLATVLGLPFGTWLGQIFGWRATFWLWRRSVGSLSSQSRYVCRAQRRRPR